MRRLLSFLFGLAGGAVIGATVAILLAPASGEDLRSDLGSRFKRFGDELQDAATQRRRELERELNALRYANEEIPLEDR
jgi:gas vesicle protein